MAKMKLKKENSIEKFKRLHPLTTKGMSDEDIVTLGDKITNIHTDNTPRKFNDVFSTPDGEKYMIVDEDGKQSAIPLMKIKQQKKMMEDRG